MNTPSAPNTGSPKLQQQCRIVECLIGRNFGMRETLCKIASAHIVDPAHLRAGGKNKKMQNELVD
jgi:hypothetical protein